MWMDLRESLYENGEYKFVLSFCEYNNAVTWTNRESRTLWIYDVSNKRGKMLRKMKWSLLSAPLHFTHCFEEIFLLFSHSRYTIFFYFMIFKYHLHHDCDFRYFFYVCFAIFIMIAIVSFCRFIFSFLQHARSFKSVYN